MYLFLACAADEKGLSYYGDKSLTNKLSMDQQTLQNARSDLIEIGLLAWQKPFYQVLDLGSIPKVRHVGSAMSLGNILKKAMEVKP